MCGFNDIQCARCGDRYGWFGEYEECPNCPHCGETQCPELIAETAEKLAEMRAKMLAELEDRK